MDRVMWNVWCQSDSGRTLFNHKGFGVGWTNHLSLSRRHWSQPSCPWDQTSCCPRSPCSCPPAPLRLPLLSPTVALLGFGGSPPPLPGWGTVPGMHSAAQNRRGEEGKCCKEIFPPLPIRRGELMTVGWWHFSRRQGQSERWRVKDQCPLQVILPWIV